MKKVLFGETDGIMNEILNGAHCTWGLGVSDRHVVEFVERIRFSDEPGVAEGADIRKKD